MRNKILLVIGIATLILTGCSKSITIQSEVDSDSIGSDSTVTLEAPRVVDDNTDEMLAVVDDGSTQTEKTESFTITDKAVINAETDDFNKQEPMPSSAEPMSTPIADTLLSKMQDNMPNIKFPTNFRFTGTVEDANRNEEDLTVAVMNKNGIYVCMQKNSATLEYACNNLNVYDPDVFYKYSLGGVDTLFYITGLDSYSTGIANYYNEPFKVSGITAATKNGVTIDISGRFYVFGEECTGTVNVGDGNTVLNMQVQSSSGKAYNGKIQTILKLPKTVESFSTDKVYQDSTILTYVKNCYTNAEPFIEDNINTDVSPSEELTPTVTESTVNENETDLIPTAIPEVSNDTHNSVVYTAVPDENMTIADITGDVQSIENTMKGKCSYYNYTVDTSDTTKVVITFYYGTNRDLKYIKSAVEFLQESYGLNLTTN